MTRTLLAIAAAGMLLAGCDEAAPQGIASLGQSFVRMFNADPNDAPVNAQDVAMTQRPQNEPFNP